jgi:hypothetical protein
MVSMLTSIEADCWFHHLTSQIRDNKIGICCFFYLQESNLNGGEHTNHYTYEVIIKSPNADWRLIVIAPFLIIIIILSFFCQKFIWHFEFFSTPQKLPHTTVDILTRFHEVWWKESNFFLIHPFLFPWQLQQSLSNRFRFFWLISFH